MAGNRSNNRILKVGTVSLLLWLLLASTVCNCNCGRQAGMGAFCNAVVAAESKHGVKKSIDSAGKVTLYGQLDELSYMCSSAGLQLKGQGPPYEVAKISLGSAAAYSGVRKGDRVLNARVSDNNLELTIERQGKTYQANVATDVFGLKTEFEKRHIKFSIGDNPFDKDMEMLSRYNIIILLDRCQSMNDDHSGVPGDLSKWAWCKQQINNFYLSTSKILEDGFELVPFNNSYQSYKGVTLWDLKQAFGRFKPEGKDKDISKPLQAVFEDHFRYGGPAAKPCIVLVLTDGKENTGAPLQNVLIEASNKMSRPNELVVMFLQVGDSMFADELFEDLDQHLVAKGARYHIVRYKPFSELRNRGVLWELLSTIDQVSKPSTTTAGSL